MNKVKRFFRRLFNKKEPTYAITPKGYYLLKYCLGRMFGTEERHQQYDETVLAILNNLRDSNVNMVVYKTTPEKVDDDLMKAYVLFAHQCKDTSMSEEMKKELDDIVNSSDLSFEVIFEDGFSTEI